MFRGNDSKPRSVNQKPQGPQAKEPYIRQTLYGISKQKRKHNELTYIALDSCILIDMADFLRGQYKRTWSESYVKALKSLIKRNIFTKMDKVRDEETQEIFLKKHVNKKGDIVLCCLPGVRSEILKGKNSFAKKFIEERMLVLEIEDSSIQEFKRVTGKLAEKYYDKGYFLDKNNMPLKDGLLVAESSFFNIILISRDSGICINKKSSNPEKKLYQINHANKTILGAYDGAGAFPHRAMEFLKSFENDDMPLMMNQDFLAPDTISVMKSLENCRTISDRAFGY